MRYYLSTEEANFFIENTMGIGSEIPTSGEYKIGDFIISSTQSEGIFGWVCVEAGAPGQWEVIGSGNAGGGSSSPIKLTAMEATVDINDATSMVNIPLTGFDKNVDILEVHLNGVLLAPTFNYDISEDGSRIVKRGDGSWNPNNITGQKMSFRAFRSEGKGGIRQFYNVVDVSIPTFEVLLGIPEYNSGSDILTVHHNGVLLMEGVDFTYQGGKLLKLDKNEPWNPDRVSNQKFFCQVLKNGESLNMNAMDLLDGSISINKLDPNVLNVIRIPLGDLSTLKTKNKDTLVSAVNELYDNLGASNQGLLTLLNRMLRQ